MKVKKYSIDGKEIGSETIELSFSESKNDEHNLYLVAKYQEAALRQGSANSKNRSAVRGGGAKPYKQKGTGRARQGTIRTPLKVGGGVIFGPSPRDFSISLNKKQIKTVILKCLLSDSDKLSILAMDKDDLKTKDVSQFVKAIGCKDSANKVFILSEDDDALFLASRNLKNINILSLNQLYVLDLMNSKAICFSESAFSKFKELHLCPSN